MHAADLVTDLGLALGVAMLTGLVFQRLGQPAVLGHLLAGLLVGPYIPLPLFADAHRLENLSELGVVLVMFGVGLELRLRKLIAALPRAGLAVALGVAALVSAGVALGDYLGWSNTEATFLGASLAVSSTMVVQKVLLSRPMSADVRDHIFSILVIQDVLAVLLMTTMTGVAAGEGLDGEALAQVLGELAVVMTGLVIIGGWLVPPLIRYVVKNLPSESIAVTAMGLCFVFAVLASRFGFSHALGAFIAGVLIAEAGRGHDIEHVIAPLRDVFAAVFFVTIGMRVAPRLAMDQLTTSLIVAGIVIASQTIAVSVAGLLSGLGARRSIASALVLGQIGEFAFLIGGIGVHAGVVRPELETILVTVAVMTAFTTPFLARVAEPLGRACARRLPAPLETLSSLQQAWSEQRQDQDPGPRRRLIRVLVVDGLLLLLLLVATTLGYDTGTTWVRGQLGLPSPWNRAVLVAGALALAGLPLLQYFANARRLGQLVADDAIGRHRASPAARRALEHGTLLVAALALTGPLVAVAVPLLHRPEALGALASLLVVGGIVGWRSATSVAGEMRSGAARLVSALAPAEASIDELPVTRPEHALGLDNVLRVALSAASHAVGRTLAALDLRASTGASVLAIEREGHALVPSPTEPFQANDVVVVAGSSTCMEKAETLLLRGPQEPPPAPEASPRAVSDPP